MSIAPKPALFFEALEATWAPAETLPCGAFTLRRGQGGGSRVSAASLSGVFDPDKTPAEIAQAEAGMRALGQPCLFMIRPGDEALDQALEARGYTIMDPVVTLACPVACLTDQELPPRRAFTLWEPLAIQRDIWKADDIGPARQANMERVTVPKTSVFGRLDEQPAGTAFVGCDREIAMLHALHILPAFRRRGLAGQMMRKAAFWAQEQGAAWMSVQVTLANSKARALYEGLQMYETARYHYRRGPEPAALSVQEDTPS